VRTCSSADASRSDAEFIYDGNVKSLAQDAAAVVNRLDEELQ
jgi:hypothetical protein